MQIKLDGNRYRVDTWRWRDVVDFAPRASVPGGAIIHSELGLYQPVGMANFQHGFGFHWDTDDAGYMRTEGRIDTRHNGLVMLWSKDNESDTANAVKEGFVVFDGDIYAWGTGGGGISGLRKSTDGGSTWADVSNAAASDYGTVNFALATGTYLFVCPDGARIEKIDTSDTASSAGAGDNSTDYKWMAIHAGYIFAGKDASNIVYYGASEDLSDLEGDPDDDTAEIYVGMTGLDTLRALSWAGYLYVAKADGLYQLGDDLQTAKRALAFHQADDNFRFLVDYNGLLVFPIRGRLLQWNGRNVNDLTPAKISDTFPYTTYGRFDNGVVVDNWLLVTARTNESTYEEHILAWDGVGWHKLAEPVTNGSDTVTAMGYDVANNYLWYHLDATADKTYYIQFQSESGFPHASFPTSGTHSLITSRIGAGFHWVDKSAVQLVLQTAGLSSTEYLTIYYMKDSDGTWVEWDTVKENGTVRLEEPGGGHTIEFKHLNLRFDFVTGSATLTPILEGWTLKLILRPDEAYGYTFDVPIASHLAYGLEQDERTAAEMVQDIKNARASKEPIELVTPTGYIVYGYLTAVNGDILEEPADELQVGAEEHVRCSFLEIPELEN